MDAPCVFCDIVAGSAPARVVARGDDALAFLDAHPAAEGHTLVVPRSHVRDIWELTAPDAAAVAELTRSVATRLRDALRPDGLTILQSNGAAAWQHVFHLHVHVIPRWRGDALVRPWTMRPADEAELDATHRRVRGTR